MFRLPKDPWLQATQRAIQREDLNTSSQLMMSLTQHITCAPILPADQCEPGDGPSHGVPTVLIMKLGVSPVKHLLLEWILAQQPVH